MAILPPDPALTRFIKPTLDTPFHIDHGWWERHGLDYNVELLSHLCPEHHAAYGGRPLMEVIDWVDWVTGEVKQVEGLQYVIRTHCSQQAGYMAQAATLVKAVFRVFLSNDNQPLTPSQLSPLVSCLPEHILRVLSGRQARKGLRPLAP